MVRLPVAFVEEILEVAQYMDQNDGRLPFSEASEASNNNFRASFQELVRGRNQRTFSKEKSSEASPKSNGWGRVGVSQR
jgi:hypothetical protein